MTPNSRSASAPAERKRSAAASVDLLWTIYSDRAEASAIAVPAAIRAVKIRAVERNRMGDSRVWRRLCRVSLFHSNAAFAAQWWSFETGRYLRPSSHNELSN